jgi:hypothetical protein
MTSVIDSSRVQLALGQLVSGPGEALDRLIARTCSDLPDSERKRLEAEVRRVLTELVQGSLKSKTKLPTEESLLRFLGVWSLLRRTDELIRKLKKVPKEEESTSEFLGRELGQLLADTPRLAPPLLGAIGQALGVETGWDHLPDYRKVIKIKWPHQPDKRRPDLRLGLYEGRADRLDSPKLRRVAWWLLRCCPLCYLDPSLAEPAGPFRPALECYLGDQFVWLAPELQPLRRRVEGELRPVVEQWLRANGLVGELLPNRADARRAFLKAFGDAHKLAIPVYVISQDSLPRPGADKLPEAVPQRLDEVDAARAEAETLRSTLGKLEDELARRTRESDLLLSHVEGSRDAITRLESELAAARAELGRDGGPDGPALRSLRDFLSAIDATYSIDTLWGIFQGQSSTISLPGLVNQFCVAMRRAGMVRYPPQDEFTLGYEHAGLYERAGFEVDPGREVRVRVERSGWALKQGRTLLPVRRARVVLVPESEVTT